jgi:tetratricopeptide (TPR) repeat protein
MWVKVLLFFCVFLFGGVVMSIDSSEDDQQQSYEELVNFDQLFVGDPVEIEINFRKLLSQAKLLEDKSIYLQILSQIALAEAMQQKFDDADKTLDDAEKQLAPENYLARVRILLERGRVLYQKGEFDSCVPFFKESYYLSVKHGFDYHSVNAAHMVAIGIKDPKEKINWNILAIDLATKSSSVKAQAWLGSLYNNLGQAYLDDKDYQNALDAFKLTQKFREKDGVEVLVKGARCSVARSLRLLNRFDESLLILEELLKEYDALLSSDSLPFPKEILVTSRGLVYEDLSKIHLAKAKTFSKLAYEDLSKDEWMRKLKNEDLEQLKQVMEFDTCSKK